jgi:hypothetical protein
LSQKPNASLSNLVGYQQVKRRLRGGPQYHLMMKSKDHRGGDSNLPFYDDASGFMGDNNFY